MPDLVEELERREGADPGEPGGRGVEAAGVVREPQRRPDVGLVDVLARVPARLRRQDRVEALGGDGHPRRPAWRDQPLVAGGDEEVEAIGVERQPARGLRGVDDGEDVVGIGRGEDRVEVSHLARGHLHRAEGDGVGALVDRLGQPCRRDGRDLEPGLDEEREEGRGELDLRDHDAAAGRQRRGDEADEAGHGRADRDAARIRVDELRELGAGAFGRLAPALPARAPATPLVEHLLQRVPAGLRRQAVARGVQVGALGREEGAGVGDREGQSPGGWRTVYPDDARMSHCQREPLRSRPVVSKRRPWTTM